MTEVRLMNAYDIMNTNATLIIADYLTPAQLTSFLNKITAYTTISGTSMNVNKVSPVLTAKFKSDLKLTSQDIISIKKIMLKYKKSNPEFYYAVMICCKIPTVQVTHTPLVVTITSSIDGSPMADVKGTLTNSKETPVSTKSGVMTYETVLGGNKEATFTHPKYISKEVDIHIISGETNSLSITMTPIIIKEDIKSA